VLAVFVITFVYLGFIWLVFFKLKWLRLTPTWGVISAFFLIHLIFVPLIGQRFYAPLTTDMRVVRHTVQLIPRLPEPTLVAEVRVKENTPVKKGDVLFVFDQSIYQSQVRSAQAAVVAAKQNVEIMQTDIVIATDSVAKAQADLDFAQLQQQRFATLAAQRAGSQESLDQWTSQLSAAQAELARAQAQQTRAEQSYAAQIDGVNTTVIEAEEQLAQAQYFLDQTELRAPHDGIIVNLQVREGMVSGIIRAGAIASLIVDEDPYILSAYRQENMRFIEPGQKVVVVLNNQPGRHFYGKVEEIWWASRRGQFVPSGELPLFPDLPVNPDVRMPIKIVLDDPTVPLHIGVGGATLILTDESNPFTWLGQISLRTYAWGRFVYPVPF
jgi:multidrug resistance efflux pump